MGVFIEKTTEQYYDEEAKQFLADRYITVLVRIVRMKGLMAISVKPRNISECDGSDQSEIGNQRQCSGIAGNETLVFAS